MHPSGLVRSLTWERRFGRRHNRGKKANDAEALEANSPFLPLFFVLAGSSIYYALPRFLYRPNALRRDTIPLGAYIVPWMRPNPSIEELKRHPQLPNSTPTYDIDAVMVDALRLNITFTIMIPDVIIDTPSGKIHVFYETRVVSSTVYLGHDSDYLYVGGKFSSMYTNPASTPDDIVPNFFQILLDTASDGVLEKPESGSNVDAYVSSIGPGGWNYQDMAWVYVRMYLGSDRWAWVAAENYYYQLQEPQPPLAVRSSSVEYDITSGTLTVLFSRFLSRSDSAEINALQMRTGERWVMGFLLELGYNTNSAAGRFVDGWPQKAYPYLSNDASWWPKLVIDLANPPANM